MKRVATIQVFKNEHEENSFYSAVDLDCGPEDAQGILATIVLVLANGPLFKGIIRQMTKEEMTSHVKAN